MPKAIESPGASRRLAADCKADQPTSGLWCNKLTVFTALALNDGAAAMGLRTAAETVGAALTVRLADFGFTALHDFLGLGTMCGQLTQFFRLDDADGVRSACDGKSAG